MQPSLASEQKATGKPCLGFPSPPLPSCVKAALITSDRREKGWVKPWLPCPPPAPLGEVWHKSGGAKPSMGQSRAPAPWPRVLVGQHEAQKATGLPMELQRGSGRADGGNVAEKGVCTPAEGPSLRDGAVPPHPSSHTRLDCKRQVMGYPAHPGPTARTKGLSVCVTRGSPALSRTQG